MCVSFFFNWRSRVRQREKLAAFKARNSVSWFRRVDNLPFSSAHSSYERWIDDDAKRCSVLNFISTQYNKLYEDLKGAVAQWIANSSGISWILRVLCAALQNQNYALPRRRTIENIIAHMYDDKLPSWSDYLVHVYGLHQCNFFKFCFS